MQIRKISKKGELTIKEILELILAAAGVFILIFLLVKLFSPDFDKNEEAAKAYFETLEKQIGKVGDGVVEFHIWDNDEVFVVYFGNFRKVDYQEPGTSDVGDRHLFDAKGNYENYICVCYDVEEEDDFMKTKCESCKSLRYGADYVYENELGQWAFGKAEGKVYITTIDYEDGKKYDFNFGVSGGAH